LDASKVGEGRQREDADTVGVKKTASGGKKSKLPKLFTLVRPLLCFVLEDKLGPLLASVFPLSIGGKVKCEYAFWNQQLKCDNPPWRLRSIFEVDDLLVQLSKINIKKKTGLKRIRSHLVELDEGGYR